MWLVLLAVYVGVPAALAGALWDAWSGYRRGERSLATAVGISCLVPAAMVGGTAFALQLGGQLGEAAGDALLAVAGVIVVIGAACGAAGLAADRRLRAPDRSLTAGSPKLGGPGAPPDPARDIGSGRS
jgi:hypothetical protein